MVTLNMVVNITIMAPYKGYTVATTDLLDYNY